MKNTRAVNIKKYQDSFLFNIHVYLSYLAPRKLKNKLLLLKYKRQHLRAFNWSQTSCDTLKVFEFNIQFETPKLV